MGNLVFQATLGGQVNLVGTNTSSTFNINVPAVNGNLVTTGDTGTVTSTMLAGSIANAKLTNSSVTVGSTAISLGSAATTVAGLTLTSPVISTISNTGTLTLPTSTDTLVGRATTDTLTNKSIVASQLTGTQTIPKATLPTGSVLQVVNATYNTSFTTTSTSFQATGLTASITPTSSTSKILILVSQELYQSTAANSGIMTIYRGSTSGTNLGNSTFGFASNYTLATSIACGASVIYLDSPATTSSTTYITAIRTEGGSVITCANAQVATITLMEIAA